MEQNDKNIILFIVFFTLFSICTFAQTENKNDSKFSKVIPNHTELRIIHSKIIDDDYYLYIKLPSSYNDSDKTYPVIYLLDGDIAFTMAWSTVRYLQYGKHLPEVIIVGIGYGSLLSSAEENMRERDYTISKLADRKNSGGGENFLNFLKTELIPYIDSEYRTNPQERVINGYSFGGLLVMYSFIKEHDLFSGYVAGSPYLFPDKEYLQELLVKSSNQLKNSKAKLFISYGGLEDEKKYSKPINRIVEYLSEIQFDETNIQKRIFEGGSHFTCPSEAMVYGLKFIFE
ncbi:MAG: alpha/beta hydrolase [Melioribacteraceae bacterium]|nr:alpha/beta hydrolase [Melioribacteraceae bacterium]